MRAIFCAHDPRLLHRIAPAAGPLYGFDRREPILIARRGAEPFILVLESDYQAMVAALPRPIDAIA